MYWQVYLHKTVISAEYMLIKVLKRAKELINNGKHIYTTNALNIFLKNTYSINNIKNNTEILNKFAELDDYEIYVCLKYWAQAKDFVLSNLADMIINRKLLKIHIQKQKFKKSKINSLQNQLIKQYNITKEEAEYFIFSEKITHSTYNIEKTNINILMNNGNIIDITSASDQFNTSKTGNIIEKHFLCYINIKSSVLRKKQIY